MRGQTRTSWQLLKVKCWSHYAGINPISIPKLVLSIFGLIDPVLIIGPLLILFGRVKSVKKAQQMVSITPRILEDGPIRRAKKKPDAGKHAVRDGSKRPSDKESPKEQ